MALVWHQRVIIFQYKIKHSLTVLVCPPPTGWALLFSTHYGIHRMHQIGYSPTKWWIPWLVNYIGDRVIMHPASDVSIPLFDTKLKVKSTNDRAENLPEHPRGERMLSELSLIWCCSSWIIKLVIKKNSHPKRNHFQLYPENSGFPWNGMHISIWRKPSLRWSLLVRRGLPTVSLALQDWDKSAFLFLKQWRGSPGRKKKTGSRHTAFLQSGNILTNCCIRGCFFPGFLLEVLDTLIFHLISPK